MDQFDTLTQFSSLQRNFTVTGVPLYDAPYAVGTDPIDPVLVKIDKAYWMLKRSLSDADADALASLTITGSPTSQGMITDNGQGDGSGVLAFTIGNNALAAVTDFDRTYYATVKVILSNLMAYTLTQYPVRIERSGISSIG